MFVITVLCPNCDNFTEISLDHIEVLTDGDYIGVCKNCNLSIKCFLKTNKERKININYKITKKDIKRTKELFKEVR